MNDLLSSTLRHLDALVGFDTRNPPRAIAPDAGIFAYLLEQLPDFEHELVDLGDGCVSLLAWRGTPRLLFNFHVDTVPADANWAGDPLRLRVEAGRAVGLGACDIKGASACMLAAVQAVPGDVALLFTSDEEAGSSRCVREFCKTGGHDYEAVILAEPTRARAVLEHRGIVTCTGRFSGRAGHASSPTALEDNALHHAARWAARAVEWAERARETARYQTLSGTCFNVGVIEGGTKPNIIASSAEVRFGFRPLPNQNPDAVLAEVQALAPETERVQWTRGFYGPTLPAPEYRSRHAAPGNPGVAPDVAPAARALAAELGLEIGEPVSFWTEASLFSEAGFTALVYGPGDIAQAHTAGEWVALDELDAVARAYARILGAP